MIKDFFGSLSKLQTIVIVALTLLVLVCLVPRVKFFTRWFNSATSEEYEPWNPENINVIKNNIDKLNKEAEDVKFQLEVLPAFEKDIALNSKILTDMVLDTPYNITVAQMQPNKIIGGIESYYEANINELGTADKKINKSLSSQIDNKRQQYTQEYLNMVNALGFDTRYIYNFNSKNYTYIISPDNFIGIKRQPPSTLSDSSKKLIDIFPKKDIADKSFTKHKISLQNTLYALDTLLLKRIHALENRKTELSPEQDKLKDEFNKKNFNINQYAVVIGIPFFIVAALLITGMG